MIDGSTRAGVVGGAALTNVIANIPVGIGATAAATNASGYLFGEAGIRAAGVSKKQFLTSSTWASYGFVAGRGVTVVSAAPRVSGFVFADRNQNGVMDHFDSGIGGIRIELTGVAANGSKVRVFTQTNAQGFYQFRNLPVGKYTIREIQPVQFRNGTTTVGSLGGKLEANKFAELNLILGDVGEGYYFGELLR